MDDGQEEGIIHVFRLQRFIEKVVGAAAAVLAVGLG